MALKNKVLLEQIRDQPHLLGHYLGYNDLTEIHSIWIKNLFTEKNYALLAHRNSYKTSCIVVGCIWFLLFFPNETILIIRKDFENAKSILDEIRKHYESPRLKALYDELFGFDFQLIVNKMEKIDLNTRTTISKESNLECIGIGGSITGKHFHRVICDDIVTLRDRVSTAERERTIMFYYELNNIKRKDGAISLLGTKWHSQDLFSKLKKDIIHKYDVFSTNILSKEYIEELRQSMTTSLFSANYLMQDVIDSQYFSDPVYEPFNCDNVIAVVDPAYSGTNTTAVCFINYITWNVKGYVWRKHIEDCEDQIIELAKNNNCGTIHIESNADKGSCYRSMKKKYLNCKEYHESENKHNKITTYIKRHWSKLKFDPEIQTEFISQVFDYEEGKGLDDAPDTLASIIRIVEKMKNSNTESRVYEIEDNFKY